MKKLLPLLCAILLLCCCIPRGEADGDSEALDILTPIETVSGSLYDVKRKEPYGESGNYSHSFYRVTGGKAYRFTAASSSNVKNFPAGAFYDAEGNYLQSIGAEAASCIFMNGVIAAPESAVLCVLNRNNLLSEVILREYTGNSEAVEKEYRLDIADEMIELEKKNPFQFSAFDRGYVTFVFDDLTADIDLVAAVFAAYRYPLVLAAIPARLNMTASGLTAPKGAYTPGMTMWDIMELAADNGGEIIVHNEAPVVTEENQYDYDFMYSYFVRSKKQLEEAGFQPRGILRTGGAGAIGSSAEIDRWLIGNYAYSNMGTLPQYRCERRSTEGTLDDLKQAIDSACEQHAWVAFLCHGLNYYQGSEAMTNENDLREILTYCQDKGIPVVTYSYIFDHFGSRELDEQIKELRNSIGG